MPDDALYGIHTARALENFPLSRRPVHRGLVHACGAVKLAARANHELGSGDAHGRTKSAPNEERGLNAPAEGGHGS